MEQKTLDEIRQRCEAATPGPWMRKEQDNYDEIWDTNSWGKAFNPLALVGVNPCDAKFIAHAREDIPALLAEIDRLTARSDTLERVLKTKGLTPCRYCRKLPKNGKYADCKKVNDCIDADADFLYSLWEFDEKRFAADICI